MDVPTLQVQSIQSRGSESIVKSHGQKKPRSTSITIKAKNLFKKRQVRNKVIRRKLMNIEFWCQLLYLIAIQVHREWFTCICVLALEDNTHAPHMHHTAMDIWEQGFKRIGIDRNCAHIYYSVSPQQYTFKDVCCFTDVCLHCRYSFQQLFSGRMEWFCSSPLKIDWLIDYFIEISIWYT